MHVFLNNSKHSKVHNVEYIEDYGSIQIEMVRFDPGNAARAGRYAWMLISFN